MKSRTIINTIFSRFLILVLSFGLVIYSTNMWGSGGKGIISIITADLTAILFISSIFSGSSVSFFASRYKKEEILVYAYFWSIFIGVLIPLIFGIFRPNDYTIYLIGLSVFSSLLTTNINLFVGQKNMKMYNFYTIMQLVLHISFIVGLVYILKITSIFVYFIAQIFGFALLFFISFFQIIKNYNLSRPFFSSRLRQDLFTYGWKSQLSAFVQFLNNRLSFYFLEFFGGMASVGIYSVGVACSEAIWTASRSLAVVLYADIVNQDDDNQSLMKTKLAIKISFFITLLFIILILLIPKELYAIIFGQDFFDTKKIILLLSPGILAIAISNIIGYYFAGINMLKILNIKSLVGLFFTAIFSFFAIPKWGITGACVVTSLSYCLSSGILLWKFYQLTDFHIKDFMISSSEIKTLLNQKK